MTYIWQNPDWPCFKYDTNLVSTAALEYEMERSSTEEIVALLTPQTRIGFLASSIASEAIASSLIEGQKLPYVSVLSSVLKKLDPCMEIKAKSDRNAETTADLVIQAISSKDEELSVILLKRWHELLFDGIPSKNRPSHVGIFRTDNIYVRSYNGSFEETVRYEAVPGQNVDKEMNDFIANMGRLKEKPVVLSAIASFYLVTIHPFEDGNGRISRAVGDFFMAKEGGLNSHFISMSSGLCKSRQEYYEKLENTQKQDNLDITGWILWYVGKATTLMKEARATCLNKIRLTMLMQNADTKYNSRQLKILYKLASGSFYGRLTAEKWTKLTKCTIATAFRDIEELLSDGYLVRFEEGRSSWYELSPDIESKLTSSC